MLRFLLTFQYAHQIGKGILEFPDLILALAPLGAVPLLIIAAHGFAEPHNWREHQQIHQDRHYREYADIQAGQAPQGLFLQICAQLIALDGPAPHIHMDAPPFRQRGLLLPGGQQPCPRLTGRHPLIEERPVRIAHDAVERSVLQIVLQCRKIPAASFQEGPHTLRGSVRRSHHPVIGVPCVVPQIGQEPSAHQPPAQHRRSHQGQQQLPRQMRTQPAHPGKPPPLSSVCHRSPPPQIRFG